MLKNEVKKPSYLVGSRLGSILGDFLRKLGDFFSKSSGHTASEAQKYEAGCGADTLGLNRTSVVALT